MFRNVIVGVDGSERGRDAIALAVRLRAQRGTITLVHVHRGLMRLSSAVTLGPAIEGAAASERLLDAERSATGVDAQCSSVAAASPGRGLHEEAERREADLIVVGSSRRGMLGRVLLRDDARASLNGAPCAVAVAARGVAGRDAPLARVGVGYDETPESDAALRCAREIASAAGGDVHVLEAVSLPLLADDGIVPLIDVAVIDGLLDDLVKEARERLGSLDGVHARVLAGHAGEELALFGADLDLLVVGSRGYGPVRRLVLGGTSDYLERHGRCSLLVVPRTPRASP